MKSWAFVSTVLVIIAIAAFGYSMVARFSGASMSFPFKAYIVVHAILFVIILFAATPRTLLLPWVFIILANFGSATFRNAFYSQLDSTLWMTIVTIIFVLAIHAEVFAIMVFASTQVPGCLSALILFAVYFGLVSPFYFGVITPKTLEVHTIEAYKIDKLYVEIDLKGGEETSREIARRHFLDGKSHAAKGTKAGFGKSINLYKQAVELVPDFSTAYAEMAYSYASMGRAMQNVRASRRIVDRTFEDARMYIERARDIRADNPSVRAIHVILDVYEKEYYTLNKKDMADDLKRSIENRQKLRSEKEIEQLEKLGTDQGFTDRCLQALAILTASKTDKVAFLKAINAKIDSNNAEIHNLLGLSYFLINDKESAKKMLERAVILSPDYGVPYLNMALVSPKKERARLYKQAVDKDADLGPVVRQYGRQIAVQKWLWRIYIAVIVIMVFTLFVVGAKYVDPNNPYASSPELVKVQTAVSFGFFFPILISYMVYENLIHHVYPISNTISYLFPTRFPFF